MPPEVTPAAVTESIVTTPAHVPTIEAAAPVAAPVVETPAVAEAPAVVDIAPVAPAVETPAAEAKAPELKLHTDTKSLLEETSNEAAKVDGETPEGAKPEGDKPAEVKPPAEVVKPAEPVVYEMKLPEHFEAPEENISAYTDVLRENNVSPEVGQRLLDMHAEHIRSLAENTLAQQHEVFAATRAAWRDEIKNDPVLGGASYETNKRAVARARDLIVPEADRAAFNEFLTTTGAGDHPAFWRALYRVSNLFDEPASPPPNKLPASNANPEPRRGVMGLFDKKSTNSFSSR